MTFLTIDLGLKCGWALGVPGAVRYGTWKLSETSRQLKGTRYLTFRQKLDALHAEQKITRVGYEIVRRHEGVAAAHVYGGLQAVLFMWAISNDIPRDEIEVGVNKKAFTGGGRASKDDMIAACQALGLDPEDDNAADALSLLDFMFRKYGLGTLTVDPAIEAAFQ